ncbi:MAG: hypothetical protein O7H41_12145 [Planctomycetota bacterium]|nr:hypothetical protein [Planctomycetota bacterium]
MDMERAARKTQIAASLATISGIILACTVYFTERAKEKHERTLETFTTVNRAYADYLKIVLDHPELNLHSSTATPASDLNSVQQRRRSIVLDSWVSMAELAFFLYSEHSTDLAKRQWVGWDAYIGRWCKRSDFRDEYATVVQDYDNKFMSYLQSKFDQAGEELEKRDENPPK